MPNYVKILAIVFLFVVAMSSVGVYTYDILLNLPVPSIVNTILGAAIASALHIVGLSYGVTIGESNAAARQSDKVQS